MSISRRSQVALFMVCMAAISLVCLVLLYRLNQSEIVSTVWLPDQAAITDEQALYDLPVASETKQTDYGQALVYTSNRSWPGTDSDSAFTTIYEFHSSPKLKASECPNIGNFDELSPTDCEKIGTLAGNSVFGIGRSLPSGRGELFMQAGNTFVYMVSGGDSGVSFKDIETFKPMPQSRAGEYLAKNKARVDALVAAEQTELDTYNRLSAEAYTKLDFTPALPQTLPGGMKLSTLGYEINGPDADNPKLLTAGYGNDDQLFITFHSGKLTDFSLGSICGPSPGYSMEKLDCHPLPGTNCYESHFYMPNQDLFRYVYCPVGDSMVMSHIHQAKQANVQFTQWPEGLMELQDKLTLSAKPVDLDVLKGSQFSRVYY